MLTTSDGSEYSTMLASAMCQNFLIIKTHNSAWGFQIGNCAFDSLAPSLRRHTMLIMKTSLIAAMPVISNVWSAIETQNIYRHSNWVNWKMFYAL